jgi:nucleoside-triphosphatase THEP1
MMLRRVLVRVVQAAAEMAELTAVARLGHLEQLTLAVVEVVELQVWEEAPVAAVVW